MTVATAPMGHPFILAVQRAPMRPCPSSTLRSFGHARRRVIRPRWSGGKPLDGRDRMSQPAAVVVRAPLPDHIEGTRLHLRRWRTADAAALSPAVERNIGHLRPWMPWAADEPLDVTDRLQLIERWERDWTNGGDVVLAVRSDDQVLGGCGLHRRCGPTGLEIGYWVDHEHLHQGVGTEVARLLTTTALGCPGISFVEIHHDKANVVSGRIPGRLGYDLIEERPDAREAPGEVGIECIWRMNASAWSREDPSPASW